MSTRNFPSRRDLKKSTRELMKNVSEQGMKSHTITLLTYNDTLKEQIDIKKMVNSNYKFPETKQQLEQSKSYCSIPEEQIKDEFKYPIYTELQKKILTYSKFSDDKQIGIVDKYTETKLLDTLNDGYKLLCNFNDAIQEIQAFL